MKISHILLIQLAALGVINASINSEVRSCMSQSLNQYQPCYTMFSDCFEDISCSNEFDDLYEDCLIPDDNLTYDPSCARNGYTRSNGTKVKVLIECLQTICGILGQNGEQEEINQQNLENAELVTEDDQNLQIQTTFKDLQGCITNALVDSSKCWLITKDCDEECIQSLNVIDNCKLYIEQGDTQGSKNCISEQEFNNSKGSEISACLMNQCFSNFQKLDL